MILRISIMERKWRCEISKANQSSVWLRWVSGDATSGNFPRAPATSSSSMPGLHRWVFSFLFCSNLPFHSCPPTLGCDHPPPVSPLPFQNNLVFSGTYTYLCDGIINWGWWWGESYSPIFSRINLKRGNQQLSLICQKPETPLPSAVCSCCFIVSIPSFNSRSGKTVPGMSVVHHGPGVMVVNEQISIYWAGQLQRGQALIWMWLSSY